MNLWVPHIPKNAGTTITKSLVNFCSPPVFEITDLYVDDAYSNNKCVLIKNTETNNKIKLGHNNPLKPDMIDWLKILVIRDPIKRFISYFNYRKYEKFFDYNKTIFNLSMDDYLKEERYHGEWGTDTITFLNDIPDTSLTFNKNDIFEKFDYIIDVTNIDKIFKLIDDNLIGKTVKKIKKKFLWEDHNKSYVNINMLNNVVSLYSNKIFNKLNNEKYELFKEENLTKDQLEKIHNIPWVKEDLEFYKLWKVKNQQSK